MEAGYLDHEERINNTSPALADAKVGQVLRELIDGYNDLAAKHVALMLILDQADANGFTTTNSVDLALKYPSLPALGDR